MALVDPARKEAVSQAITDGGGQLLEFEVDKNGLEVTELPSEGLQQDPGG